MSFSGEFLWSKIGLYGDFNICLLFNFDPITSYLLSKHLTFQLFPHLRHLDFVIFHREIVLLSSEKWDKHYINVPPSLLDISSRWEKLCEICTIIGGLNVISWSTSNNLFLNTECEVWCYPYWENSLVISLQTFHSIHCHFLTSSSLYYLKQAPHSAHSGVLAVTEGSAPSQQTVTGLDWVRPHSRNWLLFTQNTLTWDNTEMSTQCCYASRQL